MVQNDAYSSIEKNILQNGKRPIFFVGAGISIRYLNAPNWKNLLINLIEDASLDRPFIYFLQKFDRNYERIASNLADIYLEAAWENPKKYSDKLFLSSVNKDVFLKTSIQRILSNLEDLETHLKKTKLTGEYDLFKSTNPYGIITTNYDKLLEQAFPYSSVSIGQKIITERMKGNKRQILKIHGCVSVPESIVITEEDYGKFINNQKYLTAKLLTFFLEYPVIIMGYSLTDRNILGILQTISELDLKKDKIDNIWFINYTNNNFEDFDNVKEKSILLPNNKIININLINVRNYSKLFQSITHTNKYPYMISAIARELGYSNWTKLNKYITILKDDYDLNSPEYVINFNNGKRYSEEFFTLIKKQIKISELD